jgi:acetyl-CoA synthetase
MFLEYWGRPDATRDKFIGDWMTTGDEAIVDDEGYFQFVGREDDVITSSGYRIAADIQEFVKTRLSAHEYPREVAFIDSMPMTITGKIIRRLLRQRA